MKNFTCIVCPNGCSLIIDESTMVVTGNKCPRGEKYAREEMTKPMRSVTSTVRTTSKKHPVISIRTNGDIDKKLIFNLISLLKQVVISKPVQVGDIILKNVLGSGVDVIATSSINKEDF